MTNIDCAECNEHFVAWNDYLCRDCRNRLEGRDMCDYCNAVYNPDAWREMTWNEHIGYAPRFAGLCLACKDTAADSVPLTPEPELRAVDEYVAFLRECRENPQL